MSSLRAYIEGRQHVLGGVDRRARRRCTFDDLAAGRPIERDGDDVRWFADERWDCDVAELHRHEAAA